jgi:hypothetical protein
MRRAVLVAVSAFILSACHGMRVNTTVVSSMACSATQSCRPAPGICAPACHLDAHDQCWCPK